MGCGPRSCSIEKTAEQKSIYDISKETGFSPTTVSKALNNYPDVSEKTKKMFKVIIAGGRDLTPKFFPTLMIVCNHLLKNKTEVEIVSGMDLMMKWPEQCQRFGLKHEMAQVENVTKNGVAENLIDLSIKRMVL